MVEADLVTDKMRTGFIGEDSFILFKAKFKMMNCFDLGKPSIFVMTSERIYIFD